MTQGSVKGVLATTSQTVKSTLKPMLTALASVGLLLSQPAQSATEFGLSRIWDWQAAINLQDAYQYGASGQGVTIGVVDSGVDRTDAFMQAAFGDRLLTNKHFGVNNIDSTELYIGDDDPFNMGGYIDSDLPGLRNYHGEVVASIIGANRTEEGLAVGINQCKTTGNCNGIAQGIAYNSTIQSLNASVNDDNNFPKWATAARWAFENHIPILNLSLGSSHPGANSLAGDFKVYPFQHYTSFGYNTLIIASAGNDGLANPGYPARYANRPEMNGYIVAVGSVDANNQISSFSNRAGDTKDYYIVAPGENIAGVTSNDTDGLHVGSGTSFAAPVVTGVAALIKEQWNYLKGDQIAEILLSTATDLGAPGTDEIYGRGLLNAAAALAPIGDLEMTISNGQVNVGNIGGGATAPASGDAGNIETVVDKTPVVTERPYAVKGQPGSRIRTLGALSLEQAESVKQNALAQAEKAKTQALEVKDGQAVAFDDFGRAYTVDLNTRIQRRPTPILNTLLNTEMQYFENSAALTSNASAHYSVANAAKGQMKLQFGEWAMDVGMQGMSHYAYGAGNASYAPLKMAVDTTINPYASLVSDHQHLFLAHSFSGDWQANVGVMSNQVVNQFTQIANENRLSMVEVSKQMKGAMFGVSYALLNESNGALGSMGSSMLGFGGNHETQNISINGAYALSDRAVIAGNFTTGVTNGMNNQLIDKDAMQSQSWKLGLHLSGVVKKFDQMSFGVSSPLAYTSGGMNLRTSVGVDSEGNAIMGEHRINLSPEKRELRLEANYMTTLKNGAKLGLTAINRLNPNHDSSLPSEQIGMVRYSLAF